MLTRSQQPMTDDEVVRITRYQPRNWISRLLVRRQGKLSEIHATVEVDQVSVEQCFIQACFNEELPLYILDAGNFVIVLFGQWLYDPHVLLSNESTFETWDSRNEFFARFSLKRSIHTGIVFELKINDCSFIKAERLPDDLSFRTLKECQVILRGKGSVVDDLRKAGVVE